MLGAAGGAALVVDPQAGNALRLPSYDATAGVASWPNLWACSGFALDVAVWPDSANAWGRILSGPGFSLRLEGGTPVFEQRDDSGNPLVYLYGTWGSIPAGSWSVVSVQWDGTAVKLLVNGQEQASATPPLAWYNYPAGPVVIGGYDPAKGQPALVGFIDQLSVSTVTQPQPPSTTADASGHANHGTLLVDAMVVAGGQSGGGLWVGGTGGAVEVPASPSLVLADADFTIEAWVYPEPRTDEWGNVVVAGPVVVGPGYQLSLSPVDWYNGSACLSVWADGWVATAMVTGGTVPAWQWSKVVAQRTGDTVRLFINDNEVGSTTFSGSVCTTPTSVRFGSGDPVGGCFRGIIDEVRITAAPRVPPPTETADSSGNGHTGTLVGGAAIVRTGDGASVLRVGGYGSGVEVPASPGLAIGTSDFVIECSLCPEPDEWGYLPAGRVLSGPGYCIDLTPGGGYNYGPYYVWPSVTVSGEGGSVNLYGYMHGYVPLYAGEWHYLMVQRAEGVVRFFVDGEEIDAAALPGALNTEAVPVQFGSTDPYVTGFRGLLDEVRMTLLHGGLPEPGEVYASIYIPADFDPETGDTIHYFHGTRDATANDPALSELPTETASLTFRGTFADVETTISIDPATFPGLTAKVDCFEATVSHVYEWGGQMLLNATFTETGPETNLFRVAYAAAEVGTLNRPGAWTHGCERIGSTALGSYRPFNVRVKGLPDPTGYQITVSGTINCPLEHCEDGFLYLKGASLNHLRWQRNGATGQMETVGQDPEQKVPTPKRSDIDAKLGKQKGAAIADVGQQRKARPSPGGVFYDTSHWVDENYALSFSVPRMVVRGQMLGIQLDAVTGKRVKAVARVWNDVDAAHTIEIELEETGAGSYRNSKPNSGPFLDTLFDGTKKTLKVVDEDLLIVKFYVGEYNQGQLSYQGQLDARVRVDLAEIATADGEDHVEGVDTDILALRLAMMAAGWADIGYLNKDQGLNASDVQRMFRGADLLVIGGHGGNEQDVWLHGMNTKAMTVNPDVLRKLGGDCEWLLLAACKRVTGPPIEHETGWYYFPVPNWPPAWLSLKGMHGVLGYKGGAAWFPITDPQDKNIMAMERFAALVNGKDADRNPIIDAWIEANCFVANKWGLPRIPEFSYTNASGLVFKQNASDTIGVCPHSLTPDASDRGNMVYKECVQDGEQWVPKSYDCRVMP